MVTLNIYKFVLFIVVMSTLYTMNTYATDANPAIAFSEQWLDECIHTAKNSPTIANCADNGLQELSKHYSQETMSWQYADIVRRKLGNIQSLKYYSLALQNLTTPERCIDDGLYTAMEAGLNYPYQNSQEVAFAITIAFKQCWDILQEDIVNEVKHGNHSQYWLDNVCNGLKSTNKKLTIENC